MSYFDLRYGVDDGGYDAMLLSDLEAKERIIMETLHKAKFQIRKAHGFSFRFHYWRIANAIEIYWLWLWITIPRPWLNAAVYSKGWDAGWRRAKGIE